MMQSVALNRLRDDNLLVRRGESESMAPVEDSIVGDGASNIGVSEA